MIHYIEYRRYPISIDYNYIETKPVPPICQIAYISVEMSCNISVFDGPSVELYDISYDNTFAITNNKTNNVMIQ